MDSVQRLILLGRLRLHFCLQFEQTLSLCPIRERFPKQLISTVRWCSSPLHKHTLPYDCVFGLYRFAQRFLLCFGLVFANFILDFLKERIRLYICNFCHYLRRLLFNIHLFWIKILNNIVWLRRLFNSAYMLIQH